MANDEWVTQSILELQAGGGGGGTTNYNLLTNKPQIGGITLQGNKTLDELKILSNTFTTAEKDKVLTIGADGKVFANLGTNVSWSNIVGDITTNLKLKEALDEKISNKLSGSSIIIKSIGINAAGDLVYET